MELSNLDIIGSVKKNDSIEQLKKLKELSSIINNQAKQNLTYDQFDINSYIDKLTKSVYMEQLCAGQLFIFLKQMNLKDICQVILNLFQTKQRYLKHSIKIINNKSKYFQYFASIQNQQTNENLIDNQYIHNKNKDVRQKKLSAQKTKYKIREYEQQKKLQDEQKKFDSVLIKQVNKKVDILYNKLNDSSIDNIDFDVTPEILIKLNNKINDDMLQSHKSSINDVIDLVKKIDMIKNKNSNYPDIFGNMRQQIKHIDNTYMPLLKFQRDIEGICSQVKKIEMKDMLEQKLNIIIKDMFQKLRQMIKKQEETNTIFVQTELTSTQIDKDQNLQQQLIDQLQNKVQQTEKLLIQTQCKNEISQKQLSKLNIQYSQLKQKYSTQNQEIEIIKRQNKNTTSNCIQIEKQYLYYQKDSQNMRKNLSKFLSSLSKVFQNENQTLSKQDSKIFNIDLNDNNQIQNKLQQIQQIIIQKINNNTQNIQQDDDQQKSSQNILQDVRQDTTKNNYLNLSNTKITINKSTNFNDNKQKKNYNNQRNRVRKYSYQPDRRDTISDKLLQGDQKLYNKKRKSSIFKNQSKKSLKNFFKLNQQQNNKTNKRSYNNTDFVILENYKLINVFNNSQLIKFRMQKTIFNQCLQKKQDSYDNYLYNDSIQNNKESSQEKRQFSLKKLKRKKNKFSKLLMRKSSKKRKNLQYLTNKKRYQSLNQNRLRNDNNKSEFIRQSLQCIERIDNNQQRLQQIHETYKILNKITRKTLQKINVQGKSIKNKKSLNFQHQVQEAQRKTVKILQENLQCVFEELNPKFQQKFCNQVKVFIQNLTLLPDQSIQNNSKLQEYKQLSKKNKPNYQSLYSTFAREKIKPLKKSMLNLLQIKQMNKSSYCNNLLSLSYRQKSDRTRSIQNFSRLLPEVVKIKQFIYSVNVQQKNFRPNSAYKCTNLKEKKEELIEKICQRLDLQIKNFNKKMILSQHDQLIDEFVESHIQNCENCPHLNSFIIQISQVIQRQNFRQTLNLNIRDIQSINKKKGIFV